MFNEYEHVCVRQTCSWRRLRGWRRQRPPAPVRAPQCSTNMFVFDKHVRVRQTCSCSTNIKTIIKYRSIIIMTIYR